MSLLLGFGKGLQQGAQMLSQGMAEDRQVARQQELEAMREASIERRYMRDIARRDKERAEDMDYRKGRDKATDSQFNRQMSMREKQVIESNLQGVMEQEARAAEKIRAAFAKQLESGMGDTAAVTAQMNAELLANQKFYSERLHNMINSYGPQLKGTGFEYLLDYKEPELNKEDTLTGSSGKGNEPARSTLLQGYISQWNDAKPKPEQPVNGPKITSVDPAKASLMPHTSLNNGLMNGVSQKEFGQFADWMNQGRK